MSPRSINYSKGELAVETFLTLHQIPHKYQYSVKINRRVHIFDFAVCDKAEVKCFIEFDGKQHFEPVAAFGGKSEFIKRQALDNEKNQYCKLLGVNLIRIPYWTTDIDTLLSKQLSDWINYKSVRPAKTKAQKKRDRKPTPQRLTYSEFINQTSIPISRQQLQLFIRKKKLRNTFCKQHRVDISEIVKIFDNNTQRHLYRICIETQTGRQYYLIIDLSC